MATADQIEKILLQIEESGAAEAGIAVKRLDSVMSDLAKQQGPIGVVEGFNALQAALAHSLVDLPNMASLTDQATAAWVRLVAQTRKYEESQNRKHTRNVAIEDARKDAQQLAAAMKAANRIPTELQQAPKALTAGQKAFQAFGRAFGPRATQGLASTVQTLEKIGPVASAIGPPLAKGALAIGALGLAVAAGAVLTAKSFATSVIEAQAYKEDLEGAFKIARKGKGDAAKVMAMAAQTSDFLGQDRAEGSGMFLDLLTKFKDEKVVDHLVRSLADLQVADPGAKIPELVRSLGKMQGQGKLTGEVLQSLNDNGLEQGDVLAVLATRYKKTTAEVMKMISAGKISADVGREAVEAAISEQSGGGPAGSAASIKSNRDLSKLIERLKGIPKNILFDVAAGPGIDGVKDVLREVLGFFDGATDSGKEVRKVTGDMFNALIEGLTGNKVDTKKGIRGTLEAVLEGAKAAVPVVKDIASGVRDIGSFAAAMLGAGAAIKKFSNDNQEIGAVVKGFSFVARMMGSVFLGPLAIFPEIHAGFKGIAAIVRGDTAGAFKEFQKTLPFGEFIDKIKNAPSAAGAAIAGLWGQLKTAGASVINEAMNIGSRLWQGLVMGIQGGVGAVGQAAANLANSALSAVGVSWRVGSPAKAFEDLAMWGGAGVERGFDRSTPSAAAAAASMANTALGAAWTAGPANVNGGASITAGPGGGIGGAAGGPSINITINVAVPGASSSAQAQGLGEAAGNAAWGAIEPQLGAAMRRLRYG